MAPPTESENTILELLNVTEDQLHLWRKIIEDSELECSIDHGSPLEPPVADSIPVVFCSSLAEHQVLEDLVTDQAAQHEAAAQPMVVLCDTLARLVTGFVGPRVLVQGNPSTRREIVETAQKAAALRWTVWGYDDGGQEYIDPEIAAENRI